MLYIITKRETHTWHIGTPFPKLIGRVLTIQADGDELNFIKACIEGKDFNKSTGKLS